MPETNTELENDQENAVGHTEETPSLDETLPTEIIGMIMDMCDYPDAASLAQTSKTCLYSYHTWTDMRHRQKIEQYPGFDDTVTDREIMANGRHFKVVQRIDIPRREKDYSFYYCLKEVTRAVVPPELLYAFPPCVDDSYIIRLDRQGNITIFTKYDLDEPVEHLALFIDEEGRYSIELTESEEETSQYYKPTLTKM